MKAEFKEKTYESYFMCELCKMAKHIFVTDQFDEHYSGFDGAANVNLSKILQCPNSLSGITKEDICSIEKVLNNLPPFKLNLFIQFKRPEYMKSHRAKEWKSWYDPYYRYKLEQKQLTVMEKLYKKANNRAEVVYAAAAFYKNKDLFKNSSKGVIIKKSNIVSVNSLRGHKVFTYKDNGSHGIGHSEPENIETISLEEIFKTARDYEGKSFTDHIKETAYLLKSVLVLDDEHVRYKSEHNVHEFHYYKELFELVRKTYVREDYDFNETWLDDIITMASFSKIFDIKICAIAP